MNQPVVSVVIPTHNSEQTIRQCLNSLQNQTTSKDSYEIIIVDDGSKDETIKILANLKIDKLLKIDPCTVSQARNFGVKNSSGQMIAFIDSDCVADKNWIESILKEVKENRSVVGSIENGVLGSKIGWTEYFLEFSAFSPYRKRESIRWGPTCNLACMKKDFEKTGGFVDVSGSEDVLFGNALEKINVIRTFVPELKIKHLCRTEIEKVLSHQKYLGKHSTIVRKSNPSLPYSFLGQKKIFLPLVFFSKLAARTVYAYKAKKLGTFVKCLPYVILGIFSFCKGAYSGFNEFSK